MFQNQFRDEKPQRIGTYEKNQTEILDLKKYHNWTGKYTRWANSKLETADAGVNELKDKSRETIWGEKKKRTADSRALETNGTVLRGQI